MGSAIRLAMQPAPQIAAPAAARFTPLQIGLGVGVGAGIMILAIAGGILLSRIGSGGNEPAQPVAAVPVTDGLASTDTAPMAGSKANLAPIQPTTAAPAGTPPPPTVASLPPSSGTAGNPPAPGSPAAPPTASAVPGDGAPDLKYGWQLNNKYAYKFTAQLQGSAAENMNGMAVYTVLPTGEPGESGEEELGTGTAFLVSPNGHMVTCAHVVQGASKVEVTLNGQTSVAKVLSVDTSHDLAVIQIPGSGHPAVPLTDSGRIDLAEEVRVIGYPLSDILGHSIKVTRGAVSGIIEEKGKKMLQVDASINPGNSGGPVFNDRGEVVGIASAKLTNETASNVGFVVPSNDAQVLLDKFGVNARSGAPPAKMEGPELVKQVTKSIGLVTIRGQRFQIAFLAKLESGGTAVPGKAAPVPNVVNGAGRLLVDNYGSVVARKGDFDLPFMLGFSDGLVGIEALPSSGADNSEVAHLRMIAANTTTQQTSSSLRSGRSKSAAEADPILALERIAYKVEKVDPGFVTIKKTYSLKTLKKDGKGPGFEVAGEGTLQFNRRDGVPESLDSTIALTISDGSVELKIPVKLVYNRIDPNQVQIVAAPPKKTTSRSPRVTASGGALSPRSNGVMPRTAGKVTDDEFEALLVDVARGGRDARCLAALQVLNVVAPSDERRDKVLSAMAPLLGDIHSFVVAAAVDVLGTWGDEDTVSIVAALLTQPDFGVRLAAMNSLIKLSGPEAAKALAGRIPSGQDRLLLSTALRKMGIVAEAPVLKLLTNNDPQVRTEACRILGAVGGKKSLIAMKKQVAADKNPSAHLAAQSALRELQSRPLAEPEPPPKKPAKSSATATEKKT